MLTTFNDRRISCLSYLLGRSAMIKFQNVSFGYKDSAQKNSLFAKRQSW